MTPDSRTNVKKTLLNTAELMALEATAEELGLSDSALLRHVLLDFLNRRRQAKVLQDAGLVSSPEHGQ